MLKRKSGWPLEGTAVVRYLMWEAKHEEDDDEEEEEEEGSHEMAMGG